MNKEITIDGVVYVKKEDAKVEKTKKINITIKNRFTGAIIYESEKTTYRDAINEMVKDANDNGTRADLTNADLTDADLTRTNLIDTNLTGADLTGANLTACKYYMGSSNKNFEALCKAIKTIKWNSNTGADFIK